MQVLSTPITQVEANSLGLPKPEGAIVSRVEPDSPADSAGLHAGDVIVAYNGKPVTNAGELTTMVVNTAAGTRVPLAFYRGGNRQTVTAAIGELNLETSGEAGGKGGASAAGFGLSLRDITPDVTRQFNLPAGQQGALVDHVEPFTPAANAGLRTGDVIVEVNRHAIHGSADAIRELHAVTAGQPAFLLVARQGGQVFVELRRE